MASEAIIIIREKLDKVTCSKEFNEEEVLNCLEELKKISITENFLRVTFSTMKLGNSNSLNKLKKSKSINDLIKSECKNILRKWKSEILQKIKITKQIDDNIPPETNHLKKIPSDTPLNIDCSSIQGDTRSKAIDEQIIRPRKRPSNGSKLDSQPLDSIREGYKRCIYNALMLGDNHQGTIILIDP
ncbi:LOW QUALITY PROTEIN: hypothetical protein MXB_832 [Myxobolus squamalis]|nr:LOW QUALITY PROTEIN: hypothetical protein MXB_832 [Myxobolus squamalis]